MRPQPQRRDGAFTLVELMVVLLLIGIFTGVMLAEMRGTFADALLRLGARDIMSGLSLASSRAISLNQAHVFEWNGTENKFRVRPRQKTRGGAEEEELSETKSVDERLTIEIRDPSEAPEQEEFEQGLEREAADEADRTPDLIQFNPDGTADAREILLRDSNNGELVLRINPVTGRVRVQKEEQP